jgi:hypothetical protein
MSVWARILDQRPYSGIRPTLPLPEPEEIFAALAEVVAKGGITDRDSARIAAFAWYHGIESQTVLDLFRARGTRQILQQELSSHREHVVNRSEKIHSHAFRRISDFSLAKELGVPELGWAVAVLIVAAEADFPALVESLGPQDDPSRIASYFIATPRFIAPQERRILMAKLLTLGDPTSLEVAIALFSWWLEAAVERREIEIEDVFEEIAQNAFAGAVLLGAVLGSMQRYQAPPFSGEIARSAQRWRSTRRRAWKRNVLRSAVRSMCCWIGNPRTVRHGS